MTRHLTALDWARALGNEKSPRMRWHLWRCAECSARWRELKAERARFDASEEMATGLHALRARWASVGETRARSRPWFLWASVAATCGVLGLAHLAGQSASEPELRAKGDDLFALRVQGRRTPLQAGSRCAPGDRIQAEYRSSKRFLLVIAIDGEGRAQVVLPFGGAASAQLVSNEAISGEDSWVLDEAGGTQRFVAFFSDTALDAADAIRVVRTAGEEPVSLEGAVVRDIWCRKERRR